MVTDRRNSHGIGALSPWLSFHTRIPLPEYFIAAHDSFPQPPNPRSRIRGWRPVDEPQRARAQPARKTFAIGFQTGHEMNWLPRAMHVLRDELKHIHVTISSDYSPDLAEALVRGRLDVAFLRN